MPWRRWFGQDKAPREAAREEKGEATMDRAEFFREGVKSLAKAAVVLSEGASKRLGGSYIRPPGALGELDFLTHCTRCGKCVDACSPGSLLRVGGELAKSGLARNTPYLDPNGHKPCFLCEGMPCIEACGDEALVLVDLASLSMGLARINTETCFAYQEMACDACVRACPLAGDAIFVEARGVRVFVDKSSCIGCGLCAYHCPTDPSSITIVPVRRA